MYMYMRQYISIYIYIYNMLNGRLEGIGAFKRVQPCKNSETNCNV